MEKSYCPQNFEKQIYNDWLKKNYFETKINKNKKPFTIIMPPPNITAKLHIGHAYDTTIQDSIIRYKRMKGFEALLLPGTDHAALATEVKVVERLKSQGISKEDLGREKFMEKMQEWYDEFGSQILEQFKQLGLSCDWSKKAFTLDEQRCKSVRKAFVQLYNKGYIYQGKRITNWCSSCKTALSDLEVEYKEQNGNIWYLKYPVENSNEFITVATTRPETIPGDTAVAVNPNDKRFKNLIGKNLVLPIIGRIIPIIADDYVDPKFGTGMVKITPAHDPNDFEVGLRHNLEVINIMNGDGTMNENAGKYAGLDKLECRKQIVEDFKQLGLFDKVEDLKHNVSVCQRCGCALEPIITKQWYVKMDELVKPAIEKVKNGEIKFISKRFEKLYFHWMENIKDWCISRQIWSGHRIPVFVCSHCGKQIVELEDPKTCPHCGCENLVQEEDSLDTWFSSALWPFSTLGWPDNTEEMNYFYPTDLMVTGFDIIFFWVARMIFSGLEYTKQVPFKEILIHGLIRDELGRKMSKSLGNGIDPVDIINKYGSDTLRYSLLTGSTIGGDIKYSIDRCENASAFINKIWNASRFVLENVNNFNNFKLENISDLKLQTVDKWILTEFHNTIKNINKLYNKYDLGIVCTELYEFTWNKFCDWYIEASKTSLYSEDEEIKNKTLNVLIYILENILKMLHPIIPFVTENIYLNLPKHENTIMFAEFPEYNKALTFTSDAKVMQEIFDIIKKIRNVRNEMNVPENVRVNIILEPLKNKNKIAESADIIKKLAGGKEITILKENESVENCVVIVNRICKAHLPLKELSDPEKELKRLEGELQKVESELIRANKMLSNPGFINKAPKNLIDAEKQKIVKYEEMKNNILNSIEKIKSL